MYILSAKVKSVLFYFDDVHDWCIQCLFLFVFYIFVEKTWSPPNFLPVTVLRIFIDLKDNILIYNLTQVQVPVPAAAAAPPAPSAPCRWIAATRPYQEARWQPMAVLHDPPLCRVFLWVWAWARRLVPATGRCHKMIGIEIVTAAASETATACFATGYPCCILCPPVMSPVTRAPAFTRYSTPLGEYFVLVRMIFFISFFSSLSG